MRGQTSMKNESIIFLTFLFGSTLFGQTFKQYKQTSFFHTTIVKDGNIPHNKIQYEYIKRGDTILVIHKDLMTDFLELFENNKQMFDSLIARLYGCRFKNSPEEKYDSILHKTKFKTYCTIIGVTKIHGSKEIIWHVTTGNHLLAENPCYVNIVFNYKDDRFDKPSNLKFIWARLEYCEL
jgi:hypothetical protein